MAISRRTNGPTLEDGTKDDVDKATDSETAPTMAEHVTWKERISHFTWLWFAATMSTGAMAAVIAQTPNRFHGLATIGKIFYILDLVMFVAFNIAMGTRFVHNPRKLLHSLWHPV